MNRLFNQLSIVALLLATVFFVACTQKPDQKPESVETKPAAAPPKQESLQLKDLPAPVQKTIQDESKAGNLVGLSAEKENDQTVYEVELKVNGRSRNLMIDASGVVTEVESEIRLSELKPAIQAEIQKRAGALKIVMVELLTVKGKPDGYEVGLQDASGKKSEIALDPSGKLKAPEKDEKDEADEKDEKK